MGIMELMGIMEPCLDCDLQVCLGAYWNNRIQIGRYTALFNPLLQPPLQKQGTKKCPKS